MTCKYILVNIGCIECGVDSDIVGIFTDKIRADELCKKLSDKAAWRQNGQNNFEVFSTLEDNVINDNYKEYL